MDEKSVRAIRTLASHSGAVAGPAMQKSTAVKLAEDRECCPACGGSGWKSVGPVSEKRVVRCDCFLETQRKHLLKSAGIPARYLDCDFSAYETSGNDALSATKIKVERWAADYPFDRRGLLLVGPSGVGKTHLAVAALKILIAKGFHCLFSDYRELLKEIQNSYNPSVQATELGLLRPVFETDVV